MLIEDVKERRMNVTDKGQRAFKLSMIMNTKFKQIHQQKDLLIDGRFLMQTQNIMNENN